MKDKVLKEYNKQLVDLRSQQRYVSRLKAHLAKALRFHEYELIGFKRGAGLRSKALEDLHTHEYIRETKLKIAAAEAMLSMQEKVLVESFSASWVDRNLSEKAFKFITIICALKPKNAALFMAEVYDYLSSVRNEEKENANR